MKLKILYKDVENKIGKIKMGYALFTARKLTLKKQCNDYNCQLMQYENQKTQLANQSAFLQQYQNAQQQNTTQQGVDAANMYQTALAQKEKQIDTVCQRLQTLLQQAQAELQNVEKAEENAIKNSTPKYTA